MSDDRHRIVRTFLKTRSDGASTSEVVRATKYLMQYPKHWYRSNAEVVLHSMADVYVDRWIRNSRGDLEPVWIAVPIPEDCPRPAEEDVAHD